MPLQKVLFIFFLKNNNGIETRLVSNHQDELFDIYKEIRRSADIGTITNMFSKEKFGDPSFVSNKTKLNKALTNLLGKTLADFYIVTTFVIEDGINVYKIDLDDKYIRIDPKD